MIEPAPSLTVARTDYFDNDAAILAIEEEHYELVIHARSRVEVKRPELALWAPSTAWDEVAAKARTGDGTLDIAVLQFVSASRHTPFVREAIDYALPSLGARRPILDATLELTRRLAFSTTEPVFNCAGLPEAAVSVECVGPRCSNHFNSGNALDQPAVCLGPESRRSVEPARGPQLANRMSARASLRDVHCNAAFGWAASGVNRRFNKINRGPEAPAVQRCWRCEKVRIRS